MQLALTEIELFSKFIACNSAIFIEEHISIIFIRLSSERAEVISVLTEFPVYARYKTTRILEMIFFILF